MKNAKIYTGLNNTEGLCTVMTVDKDQIGKETNIFNHLLQIMRLSNYLSKASNVMYWDVDNWDEKEWG